VQPESADICELDDPESMADLWRKPMSPSEHSPWHPRTAIRAPGRHAHQHGYRQNEIDARRPARDLARGGFFIIRRRHNPEDFFWFGQMKTQTLNNMMVPSHAPTPMVRNPPAA